MRLAKFGFGLLLLRWLPFRFVTRWILRFAVWGGLIYAVARKLDPGLLSGDGQSRSAVPQPSGWTAPPADTEPPSPSGSASTSPDAATTFVAAIDETPEQADPVAAPSAAPDISGDEMIDLIVSASMALEEVGDSEPDAESTTAPRWVRGDGTVNCPPDFPVKGKASSEIYHNRESRNYDQTVPDVCFASEEDAAAAGYRPPLR